MIESMRMTGKMSRNGTADTGARGDCNYKTLNRAELFRASEGDL